MRDKDSEWENGLLIDEGTFGLLVKNGQIPPKIWDYNSGYPIPFEDLMELMSVAKANMELKLR